MSRLSHSAVSKYQTCGQLYKYHYIDRIRPNVHSAALLFGDSFDKAISALLKDSVSLEEANAIFKDRFTNNYINNALSYIPTHPDVIYSNNDFDADLLYPDDVPIDSTVDGVVAAIKALKEVKRTQGWNRMSLEDKKFFNEMHWKVLYNKGLIFIKAYYTNVLPKIDSVIAVQEQINLDNGSGDSVIGYVDLIANIKGHGPVILDNKTSSMEYEKDSVLTSAQLALYVHCLEEKYKTRKAGYIVLNKNLIKNRKKICSLCEYDGSGARHKTCNNIVMGIRCDGAWKEAIDPKVNIQIIIDEMPATTEHLVINNYDAINKGINAGIFTRNFNTCSNVYGNKCSYYNLCFKGTTEGLINVEKDM